MSSTIRITFWLLDMALVLVQGYYFQYFFGSFLEPRGKERFIGLWAAVSYGVARKGLNCLWPSKYTGILMLGKELVLLLLLVVLVLCFYRAFRGITLFLTAAFQAILDISVYTGVILLDKPVNLAFALWEWLGRRGTLALTPGWNAAMDLTTVGIQALRVALVLVLMGLALGRIVTDFGEKDVPTGRAELQFILLPALAGLVLCILLRVIMITVEEDIPVLLYQKYPPLALLLPAILLLSLLSILQGVRARRELLNLGREKNSRMLLEKQVEEMQTHMREQERLYSDRKNIRHDMKNILSVIGSLAEQENPRESRELQEYLGALGQTMEELELPFHTGNQVVDALLSRKFREAQEILPGLELDVQRLILPSTVRVRSYDLGILLGNALDNAFAACVKLRCQEPEAELFIRLISFQRGELLFLRVENSFDGRVIRKPGAEFPATDKQERELHGIGMPNMKRIAESYQGAVDWSARDGVFILAVMLKNPSSDEDGQE